MSSGLWYNKSLNSGNTSVPGTSSWIAAELRDHHSALLNKAKEFQHQVQHKSRDSLHDFIDAAITGTLGDDDFNLIKNYLRPNSPIRKLYSSPGKSTRSSMIRSSKSTPLIPVPDLSNEPTKPDIRTSEQILPSSPKVHFKSSTDAAGEYDISLQKIQMSIRRTTDSKPEPKFNDKEKPEIIPNKTPKRSPTFVSLPAREPLTVSSMSHVSRKSFATNKEPKQKNEIYSNSPIRRNRFPSFADHNNSSFNIKNRKTSEIKQIRPISPLTEKLVIKHDETLAEYKPNDIFSSILEPPKSLTTATTPKTTTPIEDKIINTPNELARPSRTPSKQIMGTTSRIRDSSYSITSNDTTKGISRSPTRYGRQLLSKNSSIASTKVDELESFSVDKESNEAISNYASTTDLNSNKKSSIGKKYDGPIKNRFLTTTLNPTNPSLSIKPNRSPNKLRQQQQQQQHKNKEKLKLEPVSLPALKKKSLMLPKVENKPKQKIVVSMNHNKKSLSSNNISNSSVSNSSTPNIKHRLPELELPRNTSEYKRRNLGGNAVALPDAARPQHILKQREAFKDTTKPHDNRTNFRVKPKTPNKNSFDLLKDSNFHETELPDIDTEDEDNVNKKILKSWAESPELQRLVLRNKDIDPKSVFGEIPKFRIEDVFESEASRIRGGPSPMKPIKKFGK